MIAMAGMWELGWNTPIKEADLWECPLRDFAVDAWHMAPVSGIDNAYVREVPDLAPLIESYRDRATVVFVDERGAMPLAEFAHPENALYVFGRVSQSTMVAHARPDDLSVRIETPAASGLLWPHQVACVLLYDRRAKQWRS